MSLPASWTLVPVTGTFYHYDGTPASGTVTFYSSQVVVIDGIIVFPADGLVAVLDSTGSISIELPSTNDPDLNVTDWAYRVVEDFDGGRSPYYIFVAHDAASIDLATAAPVVPPPELESTIGPRGYSAYEVAVQDGFEGTESEWLATLGGIPGASAYDIAVENGFVGTEAEWLESLSGDVTPEALAAQAAAEAAADAAALSETNAAASATAASTSETNAGISAAAAGTSETNAGSSATAAASSASAAGTSETNAASSATSASSSATTATTKASEASASATNAASSATAAATSETNAGNSATAAASSATAAGNSETAAAGSASTAATDATTAGNASTAAQAAQTAAESAQGAAETAATNAGDSATAAAASESAAAALIAGTALLRHGTGAPSNALGNDGDYYLDDTAPKTLYGPKAAGAWPAGVSLQGATGPTGRVPNVQSVVSAATVTPTFDNDMVKITAQAAALALANPTGTAIPGLGIVIRIKDNGTTRAISYGTQYRAIGVTLPTTTTLGKTTYLAMIYNSDDTKWDVIAVGTQA